MNKICVYAICKNESKYVDKWLENMSEADYICVLDTGSTDGTFEMLEKDERVFKVEQKVIDPWRFDVARNESMKFVPSDANILVCTDLDELFEPGWAAILRENWKPDTCRCFYWYAWGHDPAGNPTDVFRYDKITDKNYEWIFPVHEVIVPKKGFVELQEHTITHMEIRLHHFADQSKTRDYSKLLELSAKENPDSPHVQCLLARELCSLERKDEAAALFKKILHMPETYKTEFDNVRFFTYYTLGKIYAEHRETFVDAFFYLNQFIQDDETFREPYFLLAEMYNCLGKYEISIGLVNAAHRLCHQHYSWVEDSQTYTIKEDDILGVAYLNLGQNEAAKEHLRRCVDAYPNDERFLHNYITCLQNLLNKR